MADNVTITSGGNSTPPDGTIVATDQVGTAHYQLFKLVDGAADSSARIGGDATNGLDVDVTRVTGTVTTKETRAATSAVTSVNDTASSTTLLASNANRLGATIHNDSTVALYLKLGATASLTSFTVKMAADSYYEVPFGYTGIIDGIWASNASGAARITELTA